MNKDIISYYLSYLNEANPEYIRYGIMYGDDIIKGSYAYSQYVKRSKNKCKKLYPNDNEKYKKCLKNKITDI